MEGQSSTILSLETKIHAMSNQLQQKEKALADLTCFIQNNNKNVVYG